MDKYFLFYFFMTPEILMQLTINILGILITALLTYYFAKQRYTFEKLYDRKLLYIEEIYSKIISLENELKKYIYTTGAEMNAESLDKKRQEINIVQNKLFNLQNFFWEKEIILEEKTTEVIQSFLDCSIETISKLRVSLLSQSNYDPKTSFDYWDKAAQVMKDKFKNAKEQLKKDFKLKIKK